MLKGRLLNDRYKLKETIGGGGMANVYLAEDIILNREVAIKVLRLEYANDEEFIARFDREAQAATSLSHPNVVNIFDVGEEEHILYMVMEYVEGLTLKEYIQRNGPIDVEEALNIMKQITSAIAHAHANDLVHRDIKPQNILIDAYGNVKVTDFGIAIALSATALTQTNSILGSVHYLSPEQARGGTATKKSDIYSLGIVLYELLTGKLPFTGQTPVSIALKHLQADTPSVRLVNENIPQSVENIVLKSTAKDPFHRYETVYELEQAIETALYPSKINEAPYQPPVEPGEETKAIPVITEQHIQAGNNGDTLIHNPEAKTKNFSHDEENKNKEEKVPRKKKKKNKKKKWLIISVILFALLSSAVLALFILPGVFKPKEVVIPDLINYEYEEAVSDLEELSLKVDKELIFSDEIEDNHVVRMSPKPNKTVVEESTVTLYVSKGKETTTFDDYVGRTFEKVEQELKDEGYKDVIAYPEFSDKPEGEIISQVQPEAKDEVVPSETQVIFEVSAGPETIKLNNLKSMTEKEAREYLEKNELKMNKIEENSDEIPKGKVIKQSPNSDAELKKGDTVDVYISIGSKPIPPAMHRVTFTVPYEPETEQAEDEEVENDEDNEPNNEQNNEQNENDHEEVVELPEQKVVIYIEDMNNNISEVYKEEYIKEDKKYTITFTIEPNKEASYKVLRDDQVYLDEKIPFEEGE